MLANPIRSPLPRPVRDPIRSADALLSAGGRAEMAKNRAECMYLASLNSTSDEALTQAQADCAQRFPWG